jgi:hypothetical protein
LKSGVLPTSVANCFSSALIRKNAWAVLCVQDVVQCLVSVANAEAFM